MRSWRDFFANKSNILWLDQTAKRYGVRPSQLLHVTNPTAALAVDIAVAHLGILSEVEERIGEWWWIRIYELLGGTREEVSWL